MDIMKKIIKKSSLKELADYLCVSLSAVKQYDKRKKLLMLIGLYQINHIKRQNNDKTID